MAHIGFHVLVLGEQGERSRSSVQLDYLKVESLCEVNNDPTLERKTDVFPDINSNDGGVSYAG